MKSATITVSINYRCVPGRPEPPFAGLAEIHSPTHKQHDFRILAHNPEVVGTNPTPATRKNRSPRGYGFLIPKGRCAPDLKVFNYEKSLLGGFFDDPQSLRHGPPWGRLIIFPGLSAHRSRTPHLRQAQCFRRNFDPRLSSKRCATIRLLLRPSFDGPKWSFKSPIR